MMAAVCIHQRYVSFPWPFRMGRSSDWNSAYRWHSEPGADSEKNIFMRFQNLNRKALEVGKDALLSNVFKDIRALSNKKHFHLMPYQYNENVEWESHCGNHRRSCIYMVSDRQCGTDVMLTSDHNTLSKLRQDSLPDRYIELTFHH